MNSVRAPASPAIITGPTGRVPGRIHIVIGCQDRFPKYAKIAGLPSAQRTESAPE